MVKRFLGFLKEYKKNAVLAAIFVGLEVSLEMVVPFLMSILLNQGLTYNNETEKFDSYNLPLIIGFGVAMIACAILAFIIGTLSSKYTAIAANGYAANLREEEYKKIQSLSLERFNEIGESSLLIRLTSDVTSIQTCITSSSRPAIRAPLIMLFSLSFSFVMSWQLALIFLVAMPLLAICLSLIIKKIRPVYLTMQNTLDKLNGKIQEDIIGIRTIKTYSIEEEAYLTFLETNNKLKKESIKGYGLYSLTMPLNQLILYTTICFILYFSGVFHKMGLVEAGTITSFITYAILNMNALIMLSSVANLFAKAQASFTRIDEVLSLEDKREEGIETKNKITSNDIEFRNVSFAYGDDANFILKNICLSINANEKVGILGPTGSCKSTLMNLIDGLYEASEGNILIGGIDIKEYSDAEIRVNISLVPQQNNLFSGTILENLRWGNPLASLEECEQAAKIACCYDFIIDMPNGFDSHIEQGGRNLSGGQRQRLCLARAIVRKPKILLLDDSTSALDKNTEKEVLSNLRKYLRDTTVLMISQKVSSLKDMDRIILMDEGKILDVGKHEELLKKESLYKEIYELQKEAGSF